MSKFDDYNSENDVTPETQTTSPAESYPSDSDYLGPQTNSTPTIPAVSPKTEESSTNVPMSTIVLTIGVLSVAAFVVILNETIMTVALPLLMREFSVPEATVQWLTTGYMLTMAVMIPLTGWLLTRVPLRVVFLSAMSVFIAGTLLAGFAPEFWVLVTARVVQATGTAIMMPLLMTTAMTLVPAHTRGRTMGIISIVIALAPALGPTAGGFVLTHFSWRWVFWGMLPIAGLATIAGMLLLRNVIETRKIPLDIFSFILSGIGFSGLIYGISSLGEAATGDHVLPPWIPMVIGAISLTIFVLRQLSLKDFALLDMRIFKVPDYGLAIGLTLTTDVILFGLLILMPMYMQNVLGFSTEKTGIALLPGGLVMGLLGWFIGRLYDQHGTRPLVIPGAILTSATIWAMTLMDENTSMFTVMIAWFVLSVGFEFVFAPLMTYAMALLPKRYYSHGSATYSTLMQLAAATGTALFITVLSISTATGGNGGPRTSGAGAGTEALMSGVQHAIMVGAVLSVFLVIGVFFLDRKSKRNGAEGMASVAAAREVAKAARAEKAQLKAAKKAKKKSGSRK